MTFVRVGLGLWLSYSGKAGYLEFPVDFVAGHRDKSRLAATPNFTFTPSA
jgi:hypothetical protein